ncbi:MAG: protein-disulfide reductase DsbD, partial [Pseudomonadales bacterium]
AKTDYLPVDEAFALSWERNGENLELRWKVAEGYYLYDKRLKISGDLALQKVTQSLPKSDPYFGEVQVYRGELLASVPVGQTAGSAIVGYQGCADAGLCYPPQKVDVSWAAFAAAPVATALVATVAESSALEAAPDVSSIAPQEPAAVQKSIWSGDLSALLAGHSLWVTLLIFFALGLGLTFTPCVLPMLPILSSIVVGQQASKGRAFTLGMSYVQGMALIYAAAGLITASLGAAGNIQAAMQQPWVLIVFAIFFAVLAAAMFGLYELQLPAFIRDKLASGDSRQGVVGVFITGAVSALVVSPCVTAPLAGALLYISASGDLVSGGLALYAMALGMGVPLILVVVLGSHWLPKSGMWMNSVKAVFGVLLLGVSIWLLSRLWSDATSLLVWGAFLVVICVVAGALNPAEKGWPSARRGVALLGMIWGCVLIVGGFAGASDPLRPLSFAGISTQVEDVAPAKLTLDNVAKLQDLQQRTAASGKPLLVKVAADWCVSCAVMEKTVFAKGEVKSLLAGAEVVVLDVTDNTAAQQQWQQRYGIFGPPAVLLYDTAGETSKQSLLLGEVTAEQFVAHYKSQL